MIIDDQLHVVAILASLYISDGVAGQVAIVDLSVEFDSDVDDSVVIFANTGVRDYQRVDEGFSLIIRRQVAREFLPTHAYDRVCVAQTDWNRFLRHPVYFFTTSRTSASCNYTYSLRCN